MSRVLLLLICLGVIVPVHGTPLGIRNNNPGNLIQTSIEWRGKIDCKSRFECFNSPKMGIRAMAINIQSYYNKYNLKTINTIINRWSPPHENRTSLLSSNICRQLAVDCRKPFDLNKHFKGLINALIVQENGYNPYSDKLIEEVLNGLANSDGNHNNGGGLDTRRDYEIVGAEATVPAPAARDDNEVARANKRLSSTDSGKSQCTLPVDSPYHRPNSRVLSTITAQISSSIQTRTASYSWLDRVESGILVLRRQRGNGLEDTTGPRPDAPRHPRRQPYLRSVFRGIYCRAPIIYY